MTGLYRRILLAGVGAFALLPGMTMTAAAWAQGGQSSQDDRPPQARQQQQQQRRLSMLAQRLNLTNEQKQQWLQIQRQTTQKVRATRKDDSLSEEQMQAQLREIHKQQREQVMALLTPEQQTDLKAFWEEQRQKQQEKASDNNGPDAGSATQNSDSGKEKDDDLFAGMVSDDPAPAPPPQNKRAAHK